MGKFKKLLVTALALSTLAGCKLTNNDLSSTTEEPSNTNSIIEDVDSSSNNSSSEISESSVIESDSISDSTISEESSSSIEESSSISEDNSSEESSSTSEEISSEESSSTSEEESSSTEQESTNPIDELQLDSIGDTLADAMQLAGAAQSERKYTIKGTIKSINNETYGNGYITDGKDEMYFWGMYTFDGSTRYDAMDNPPKVGDEIIITGLIKNYVKDGASTYEIINTWLLAVNGEWCQTADNGGGSTGGSGNNDDYSDLDPVEGWTYTGNYYNGYNIDLDGSSDTLLATLRALNSDKRKRTVGYSGLWTYYGQTDYDPNNSSKYIAFYRGTSASKGEMNKEHVWPKSHGGNLVEGDIHMTRPTLSSDNSDRGNSFYVEGKNSTTIGWDPYAAGMTEYYRGIAARIIFYCVIADSRLSLIDENSSYTTNANPDYKMGKLSDLLKWNLEYEVDATEYRRNDGAQNVQGNRNPFIDNRRLACAIWGNTNAKTKQICSSQTSGSGNNNNNNNNNEENSSEISEEHSEESSDISIDPTDKRTYQLVTSSDQLVTGAQYVVVCTSLCKAMASTMTNTYFNVVDVLIANRTIDVYDDSGIGEWTLGGSANNYTLKLNGQALGVTAVKKLGLDTGTTTWKITVSSDGTASISSTNSSFGSLFYNATDPRFTTYATAGQKAVSLYKLVVD